MPDLWNAFSFMPSQGRDALYRQMWDEQARRGEAFASVGQKIGDTMGKDLPEQDMMQAQVEAYDRRLLQHVVALLTHCHTYADGWIIEASET